MAIQVFVDESGIDASGPILSFAGVIGKAEDWLAFSDRWKAVLNAPPQLRALKMTQAVSSRIMAAKLRSVMNDHPFTVIFCSADLSWFKNKDLAAQVKPMHEPYHWLFGEIILSVAQHLMDEGQKERFEIIFDKNVILGPRAKTWYPLFVRMTELEAPHVASILPVDPLFRDDEDAMPLQAADVFAWLTRANLSGTSHPFGWLREMLPEIKLSPRSTVLTRADIEWRTNGMLNPKMQALMRQYGRELIDGLDIPR